MTTVIDGQKLALEIRSEVAERVGRLRSRTPKLVVVIVGDDAASRIYIRGKRRACERAGLVSEQIDLPAETAESELLSRISALNRDPEVHGILVQLPLPPGLDPYAVARAIDPAKDVDCLHPENVGRLVQGNAHIKPCTAAGVIEILDRHDVPIEGSRAVVIGRSEIVGKPLALLLLHRHATVTVCHSRTRDLPEIARSAEILIAAVGRPRMVEGSWIKDGAAVIDVGQNRLEEGLVGDVDFDAAVARASLITPVPGGVGPLTIAMLLRNTIEAYEQIESAARSA